jgi:hypothetical protein
MNDIGDDQFMKFLLHHIFILLLSISVAGGTTEKTGVTHSNDNETKESQQPEHKRKNQILLSEKDAELLVQEYLGLKDNDTLYVEVDHNIGNKYVVHVYEVVNDDDFSHTATYGWYYVYKESGKIEDMMQ